MPLQGLLEKLVASQNPLAPTDVIISQAMELQIKLIVFSQITLQRFFDDVPIAARAFLVHKVKQQHPRPACTLPETSAHYDRAAVFRTQSAWCLLPTLGSCANLLQDAPT